MVPELPTKQYRKAQECEMTVGQVGWVSLTSLLEEGE